MEQTPGTKHHNIMTQYQNLETLGWVEAGEFSRSHLRMIDQTLLPVELKMLDCRTIETVWEAIKMLRVRGAPAIGIAAAYGLCVGLQPLFSDGVEPSEAECFARLKASHDFLAGSRPTAVNLFWALDRMVSKAESLRGSISPSQLADALLAEAKAIHEEDRRICRAIGNHGAALVKDGDSLLTHCNAGGLATADYGTALAVFFAATEQGKRIHVFADETRPLLQGARLTSWELWQRGIDVTLICDSMAALVMRQGRVNAVFVGADRIAANGDTANKIGTYGVAVAAKAHGVPFYVAAPVSTFDLTIADGGLIPIEERDPDEIRCGFGTRTAPAEVRVYNPAFDVTPAELLVGIVTEHGVISPVNSENVAAMVAR